MTSIVVGLFIVWLLFSRSRSGIAAGSRHLSVSAQRRIDQLGHDLEVRTEELDLLSERVAELENRLDFAERLLADQRVHASNVLGEPGSGETRRSDLGE